MSRSATGAARSGFHRAAFAPAFLGALPADFLQPFRREISSTYLPAETTQHPSQHSASFRRCRSVHGPHNSSRVPRPVALAHRPVTLVDVEWDLCAHAPDHA